jgi:proline iminopeptidase
VRRPLVVVATASIGYLVWLRPRLLRWGATDDEAAAALPGDELLESVSTQSTMATTIDAPPEKIWPWLVQMGCDRAGWYSWDWLDNARRPSAERIVAEWQSLAVGDRLSSTPSGSAYFTAAVVDPPHALVLRADLTPTGVPFDPDEEPPRAFTRSTWALVLRAGEHGGTRFVVRTRSMSLPEWPQRILNTVFWEPAHAVMQRRQFENLRRRTEHAERGEPTPATTPTAI